MAELLDQRPTRSRKPKIHFDDIIEQSLAPKNPAKPTKPPKSAPKSTQKSKKPPTKSIILDSGNDNDDDVVKELCSQALDLDITDDPKAKKNTKKKAKAAKIACLAQLSLQSIMDKSKPLKEVKFKAFDPREPREPKANILDTIDPTNLLELLDLFIPPEIYSTIAKNTNLYAIAHNACTTLTSTNKRY